MSKKILTLLRHAKAETGAAQQDDKERRLIARGQEATHIVGKYLRKAFAAPDKVLCSAAIRTTETLLGIEQAYGVPLPVAYLDALYLASAREIIGLIEEHGEVAQHVMIVGHNPGIHELAVKLCGSGDASLIDTLAIKFPTCAAATFHCHMPDWQSFRSARTELVAFQSPKMLGQKI
jgi:phosphohistidine phosphatase